MKVHTKNKLLVLMSILLAFFMSLFIGINVSLKDASAENVVVSSKEYTGFEMEEGVEMRLPNNDDYGYGIRFIAQVSDSALSEIKADYQGYQSITFYMLIARQSKVPNGDIANLTPETKDVIKVKSTQQPIDGYTSIKVSLVGIPETSKGEALLGKAYADVVDANGITNRIYAKAHDNAWSLNQVSLSFLESGVAIAPEIAKDFFTESEQPSIIGVSENNTTPTELVVDLSGALKENEKAVVAYYGTKKLTSTIVGDKLTLTNVAEEIGTLALGEEKTITVYTDAYNAYNGMVVNATKVIDEASDLSVFCVEKGKFITGYFVVTQDIDASSWAGNSHTLTTTGAGSTNEGFKGTLNMLGHTITLNTSKYGLLGSVNYGKFLNGKFVFTESSGLTQSYGLAYCMGGKGDYAGRTEFTNVDFVVNNFGAGSANGDNSAVICYRHEGYLYINNCNFTIDAVAGASNKTTGLIAQIRKDWSFYQTNGVLYVNNVEIKTNSTAPLFMIPSNQNGKGIVVNYWASNDGKTTNYNEGVYVLSNPYTANGGTVCTGATRDLYKVETVNISDTYMYSVDDGYFVQKGTGTVFNLASLVAEELEIESYTIATDGVSYSNGVLSGIKENGVIVAGGVVKLTTADATYWTTTSYQANQRELRTSTITLASGDDKYTLEFYAYTKVLNEASDFKVFDLNTTTNEYVVTTSNSKVRLNGFFALSNDIAKGSTGTTHSSYTADLTKGNGFRGVFDGNGFSAELTPGNMYGIFGSLTGALIKNVTFKLHLLSWGGAGLAVTACSESTDGHTYLSKVNVEVQGNAYTHSDSFALFRSSFHSLLTLTDVNVTMKFADGSESSKTTGLLIGYVKNYASTSELNFTNVVVKTNATTPIVTLTNGAAFGSNTVRARGWASDDGKTADDTNFIIAGVTREALSE